MQFNIVFVIGLSIVVTTYAFSCNKRCRFIVQGVEYCTGLDPSLPLPFNVYNLPPSYRILGFAKYGVGEFIY